MKRRLVTGFTLLELTIAMAIMAVVSVIGVTLYRDYAETGRVAATVMDIRDIELAVSQFEAINYRLPDGLTDVDRDQLRDPWGNAYRYLNLAGANQGEMRKDRNLVPINSDYDLYSLGPDGESLPPLTAAGSRDDILRANNGGYVGAADAY